jgi:phosphomannomutase
MLKHGYSLGGEQSGHVIFLEYNTTGDGLVTGLQLLKAIKTILDYKIKDSFIELTADQEKELLLASKEGKKGQTISQSEMDQKVEKWLNER